MQCETYFTVQTTFTLCPKKDPRHHCL